MTAGERIAGVVECRALEQQGLSRPERRALPEMDDPDPRRGAGYPEVFCGRGREVEAVADRDADPCALAVAESPARDAHRATGGLIGDDFPVTAAVGGVAHGHEQQ